jgi:hypothetical protein
MRFEDLRNANGATPYTYQMKAVTVYRGLVSGGPYTERFDIKPWDWLNSGVRGYQPVYINDLGASAVPISYWNGAYEASYAVQTGNVALTADTHVGADSPTTLSVPTATFLDDGVRVGYRVNNTTDGSSGTITAVTQTTIVVAALVGGGDNLFQAGDVATVTKEWSGVDETGYEPDGDYVVDLAVFSFNAGGWWVEPATYIESGFVLNWVNVTADANQVVSVGIRGI